MNPLIPYVKRGIDIVASIVGLLLTLPFYPLIALAIKLESEGPVFYSQQRVKGIETNADGKNEYLLFKMVKFRSMCQNAEAKTGAVLAKKNDMRITKVGRFLRKSRLDELPQFWSVLIGDMSLVGPRPERPELLEKIAKEVPFFEERVRNMKPGITGLAQIHLNYEGELTPHHTLYPMKKLLTNPYKKAKDEDSVMKGMRTKMLFDSAYSASMSKLSTYLTTEITIILQTPIVMLFGRGR